MPTEPSPASKRSKTDYDVIGLLDEIKQLCEDIEAKDESNVKDLLENPLLKRYLTTSAEFQAHCLKLANGNNGMVNLLKSYVRATKQSPEDNKFAQDVRDLKRCVNEFTETIGNDNLADVRDMLTNKVFFRYLRADKRLQQEVRSLLKDPNMAREMRNLLMDALNKDFAIEDDEDEEEEDDEDNEEEEDGGDQAMDQESSGPCVRTKAEWERVVELAKRGKFDEIDAEIKVRFFHNILAIYKHANNRA